MRFGSCTMNVCRHRHLSQDEYDDEIYHLMTRMVYERCKRFHMDVPLPPVDRRVEDVLPPPMDSNPYSRGGGGPMPPLPGPSADYRYCW